MLAMNCTLSATDSAIIGLCTVAFDAVVYYTVICHIHVIGSHSQEVFYLILI
jgi:hypothetical protein